MLGRWSSQQLWLLPLLTAGGASDQQQQLLLLVLLTAGGLLRLLRSKGGGAHLGTGKGGSQGWGCFGAGRGEEGKGKGKGGAAVAVCCGVLWCVWQQQQSLLQPQLEVPWRFGVFFEGREFGTWTEWLEEAVLASSVCVAWLCAAYWGPHWSKVLSVRCSD
jgi:hypothetical protein